MVSPAPVPVRIRFDAFELDASSCELRKSGILLKLRPQPFRVLLLLIEHAGQVVSREEIQRCLWSDATFVDFEHGINFSISQIRVALADNAEHPRYIETLPKRGYRFIGTFDQLPSSKEPEAPIHGRMGSIAVLKPSSEAEPVRPVPRNGRAIASLAVVAAVLAGGAYFYFHRAPVLTEKDTVVLADFTNTTGDAVFDDALKQALAMQLQQSPFLNILSDQRVHDTLFMMGQPVGVRLTPQLAREVCLRTQSAVVLEGSIATLGNEYVISLNAVNCHSEDALAYEQAQVARKQDVLQALSDGSTKLRAKLGESLRTVEKFNTPIAQVSTSSLEALKVYSLGRQQHEYAAAVHFYQRAVHLDPNFAMGYASLGSAYFDLAEYDLAAENTKKAYDLRSRVSEWERFCIESTYEVNVTGNLDKARQTFKIWAEIYPRSAGPQTDLAIIDNSLGQYDNYLSETLAANRAAPDWGEGYANLASAYLSLNRLAEARATLDEAQAKKLDSPLLHLLIYQLAFLHNDPAVMTQQVAWAANQPGVEDVLISLEADTAAFYGRLEEARDLSRQASASAVRAEKVETAGAYEAEAALREALFGSPIRGVRQGVASALKLSKGQYVSFQAALALAIVGDLVRAQTLADDLARRFPENTVVQFNYLPTIRAQLAMGRKDASKAIETLQAAIPYELGSPGTAGLPPALYPVYVRAEAYRAAHRGSEAAVEFQRVLRERGLVVNEPIGALAHLGLARAYVLNGDSAKALTAYENFLTLWKDADRDVAILNAAKVEYSKLKR